MSETLSNEKSRVNKSGISLNGNGVILVELAFIAMMVMFIEIMLVPALPTIAQFDFPEEAEWVSWVLSAYLLTGAVATPLLGRLGDIYGKKRIMVLSMIGYVIGLVGCAFSSSMAMLIGFRAVQGIGMGMFPLAFGIVRDIFPRRSVPVAIGIISAMFSVGVSIGLLGGGWIVSNYTWRDAFDIVAPLMAIMTIVVVLTIKESPIRVKARLDLLGAMMIGLGVFSLLLGLTQGDTWGWTSITILGLFALSAITMVSFIFWERRVKDPIVSMKLMSNRGIFGVNLVALFIGLSMFLIYQTLPFFLMSPESVGGLAVRDTFEVGVYMFPSALAQLIFAPLAGRWSKWVGADRILMSGLLITALGYVMVIAWHTSELAIMVDMFILGLGIGFCMVSLINVVAMASPQEDFGVCSGMNTLFRVIGGSVGPVLAAVILSSYLMIYVPPGTEIPIELYSESGYIWAWIAGLVFTLIGLAMALLFRPGHGLDFENEVPSIASKD